MTDIEKIVITAINLAKKLIRDNNEIFIVDNLWRGKLENLNFNDNNFHIEKLEIKTCSLNNWEIITEVIYNNNTINSVSEENEPLGENFTLAKYTK